MRYKRLLVIGTSIAIVAAGGFAIYHKYSKDQTKSKIEASIKDKQFKSDPNIEPVFKSNVETKLSLDTKEGMAQYHKNLELIDAKLAIMKQHTN